ncbi:MAG: FkbM family methyltransferase [Candidatus Eremiobacteraeota bacterium]|nr:FkbM family methyltransferase [Candidatus Eremiobacteraeota bacterium]
MFGDSRSGAAYVGGGRVLLRTRNGFKMYVDGRDVSIAPHLILDGVWEEWTERALLTLIRPGMTILEAGANVGYFTLLMAKAAGSAGSVHSFECDPDLATLARDNVEINGLHRVARVVEKALGEKSGRVTFYRTDRHRGGGSIVAGLEQIPHNPTDQRVPLDVEMTTLDDYCAANSIVPDLIKLDAEGAEPAILRGSPKLLASPRALTLVMEFFPRFVRDAGDDPASVLQGLRNQRFELNAIDERRRRIVPATAQWLLERESSELILRRS